MGTPTIKEQREQLADAEDSIETNWTKWPGMSYEDGVASALRWALGDDDTKPMEDG